jgi:hypothetical protein
MKDIWNTQGYIFLVEWRVGVMFEVPEIFLGISTHTKKALAEGMKTPDIGLISLHTQ